MSSPDFEAALAAARARLEAHDYEPAARSLRQLIKLRPGHADAHYRLGLALLGLGLSREACGQLRAAIEARPELEAHWLGFCTALLRSDQLGAAASALAQARARGLGSPALAAMATRIAALQQAPIRPAGELRVLRGTRAGQRQPVLLLPLQLPAVSSAGRFAAHSERLLGLGLSPAPSLAQSLLDWTMALQRAGGQPVFGRGALLDAASGTLMVVPYDEPEAAQRALRWALSLHAVLLVAEPDAALSEQLQAETGAILRLIRAAAPQAGTTVNFLAAAHELGLPWQRVSKHHFIYQVGQGAAARSFNSSLTDRTSNIGVKLAKNKALALDLLGQLGLPVPRHHYARDPEAAVRLAAQLGYPVVVKPMNLDLGLGVAAGLKNPEAVRRAFAAAASVSKGLQVYVEEHIAGGDFRLIVVGGRLVWALQRIPAGVTGDGRHSVSELLAALNADPRRGRDDRSALRLVELDAEARELLAEQGLGPDAVPAAGQRVELRRIANISRGAEAIGVLDRVHPANRRLAERAAAGLGLDIAGVDFITPDISKPWHEVGGAICEVNAQPSIGTHTAAHLYPLILKWMLAEGDGRIPIAAICVQDEILSASLAQALHARLCAQGLQAGLASAAGAWIGAEQVCWDDRRDLAGGHLLLSDRSVAAAVLSLTPTGLEREGLPFDRCSVAAILPGAALTPAGRELLQAADVLVLPANLESASLEARVIRVADDASEAQWLAALIEALELAPTRGQPEIRLKKNV